MRIPSRTVAAKFLGERKMGAGSRGLSLPLLRFDISGERSQICDIMKTATIRDLRYDFGKIEAWLAGGKTS